MLGFDALASFTLASIPDDAVAVVVGNDGDGPPGGSRRRRYRYGERFTPEEIIALQRALRRKREQQKSLEELAAFRLLEAEILAQLEAMQEPEIPVLPAPYQVPLELLQAFGYGQHQPDRAALAEIVQNLELVANQLAAEQQRLRDEDDAEALLLLT
jgi:hypothetical protein